MQTIFAQATPVGKSALSIIRISGPETCAIMSKLAPNITLKPRYSRLAKLREPGDKHNILDEALVLYFEKPNSYTGEDSAELYLHGSPIVTKAVQMAISRTKLARVAEPGEFTKRAFNNKRLDFSQVEGIRDLLAAETELQRQTAIKGAIGEFTKVYNKWRSTLVHASGMLAAEIDFSEDNGFEETETATENAISERVRTSVQQVRDDMYLAVRQSNACSEIIRQGLKISLLGTPNSGKSSLTNYLVKRSACIVSDVPGTTRDVVEIALEIGGHKVVLYDTAGIRESDDKVEKLGIEKALEVASDADFIIALDPEGEGKYIKKEIAHLEALGKTVLPVTSKCDLGTTNQNENSWNLKISTTTGEGMDSLIEAICAHCNKIIENPTNNSIGPGMSLRACNLLETEAIPGLDACLRLLKKDIVISNAELQRAVSAIGAITGDDISTQEVLGVVFGEFCVGK